MKTQNYKNHLKFYPPHHFVLLPALLVFQIVAIWKAFTTTNTENLVWTLFSIVIFLFIYISIMMRQHYALGNQDRIIRLEFLQRYYELYGERSEPLLDQLNFGQIAALRFAYDDEFKILLEQALKENLSGKEIKQAINNWRGDYNRL